MTACTSVPLAEQVAAIDAAAVAERIASSPSPRRAAVKASTVELIALAARARDLEIAAARTVTLLALLGEAGNRPAPERPAALPALQAAAAALTGTLQILGYIPDPQKEETTHDDARPDA